jgi:hypothetical protein
MVELLAAGLIVVLIALLAAAVRRRRPRSDSITEAQARENAAPLTMAILNPARRERTGL